MNYIKWHEDLHASEPGYKEKNQTYKSKRVSWIVMQDVKLSKMCLGQRLSTLILLGLYTFILGDSFSMSRGCMCLECRRTSPKHPQTNIDTDCLPDQEMPLIACSGDTGGVLGKTTHLGKELKLRAIGILPRKRS